MRVIRVGGSGRGVTLVELLVAIMVLVVSAVGLLAAYQSAIHLTEVAQQANVAVNDLRDMMERIENTAFANLQNEFPNGAVNGVVGAGTEKYGAVIGGYTLSNEQVTVTHLPNTGADPRELVVQITWTNRGRTYQRSLSTIRSGRTT